MPSSISRGPITTRIITELLTANFPVGDNASPVGPYGWVGEPNGEDSEFIPYMTLTPLTSQMQRPAGALGDTTRDWVLPYSVFYAGLSRKQTEALADRMRNRLTNIVRETIETPSGDWKIQKVTCTAIGGSNRIGSAYPDHFSQADTFELWVSKGK